MAVHCPAIGNIVTAPLFPDKDIMVWGCPNSGNRVKIELRREKR